ncbi:hypothetical protein [Flavicella sediminum]|uniref:hypothetical protein n=1 Tax=Flavicella sediminum TaxID=2585141 RepID=UPI001122AAA8|nr:hypothetical protein [Flavicella sediminum]
MNPILRNILAVVLSLILGSAINMGVILVSSSIIPPPEGVDNTTMEGLAAGMHLFEAKHFLFPFLAHALGTLVAATCVLAMVKKHQQKFAYGIGFIFLLGGISNVLMLPSPTWFVITDLSLAYLPIAWLSTKLISKK